MSYKLFFLLLINIYQTTCMEKNLNKYAEEQKDFINHLNLEFKKKADNKNYLESLSKQENISNNDKENADVNYVQTPPKKKKVPKNEKKNTIKKLIKDAMEKNKESDTINNLKKYIIESNFHYTINSTKDTPVENKCINLTICIIKNYLIKKYITLDDYDSFVKTKEAILRLIGHGELKKDFTIGEEHYKRIHNAINKGIFKDLNSLYIKSGKKFKSKVIISEVEQCDSYTGKIIIALKNFTFFDLSHEKILRERNKEKALLSLKEKKIVRIFTFYLFLENHLISEPRSFEDIYKFIFDYFWCNDTNACNTKNSYKQPYKSFFKQDKFIEILQHINNSKIHDTQLSDEEKNIIRKLYFACKISILKNNSNYLPRETNNMQDDRYNGDIIKKKVCNRE